MEKENKIKKIWNWLWNSDSILSFAILLILIFIFIKLILFPSISLIFGTSLPLAIVESSSMDHNALQYCKKYSSDLNCATLSTDYEICGNKFSNKKFLDKEEYWQTCGSWYEEKNISKEQFSTFKFSNGFRKGDIIIIFGKKLNEIKIGDVLIFQSKQPTPIIHRIISLSPLQTKGDHNGEQIGITPDPRGIDETNIKENQIIGVAVGKIPYLGLVKIFAIEHPLIFWPIILVIVIFSFANPFSKKEQ
jgi:signal peptidase I